MVVPVIACPPALGLNPDVARRARRRNCLVFDYPGVGEFKALAIPYKFLGWDNPEIGAPPALGADTARILQSMLGYSDDQISALKAARAI